MRELTFDVQPVAEVLAEGLSGPGSLVDQTFVLLRQKIVSLALPPELPLVEQEVAGALSISKTPVREALIRLSQQGLVLVQPKSGSFVTPISLDRYFEACFVRAQLETGCVRRLASQRIGMTGQVQLESILTEQQQAMTADDDALFFALDERFHRTLFELAGLQGVWTLLQQTKAEIDRVRHVKRYFGIRQRRTVIQEHRGIVDAILNQDADQAKRYLLDNIGSTDKAMSSISENPQLLRTIDDLNQLVSSEQQSRPRKAAAQG